MTDLFQNKSGFTEMLSLATLGLFVYNWSDITW